MYKGTIATNTALTANTNIPLTTVLNTNSNTKYDDTNVGIDILQAGLYDVKVSLPLTNASATPLIVQLYANGNAISECTAINDITASTGFCTYIINNVIKVSNTVPNNYALISLRISGGTATTKAIGTVIIERRK